MTDLVTGGAGFIGSHLVERLVAEGSHVRLLDAVVEQPADAVEALVAAARSRGRWLLVNASAGIGTSSLAVADAVRAVMGRKVRVRVLPEQVGEPARAVADPAASTKRMGWSPAVGLTEGLHRTWAWRRAVGR